MKKTLLLIGSPNSGKTTLFNLLCKKSLKVSNYAGITVDVHRGEINKEIELIDLPGIYSPNPKSLDEGITLGTLAGFNPKIPSFHYLIQVIDSSRMEQGLALSYWLQKKFGERLIVLINKSDLLVENTVAIEQHLQTQLQLPCYFFSSLKGSADSIKEFLLKSTPQLHPTALAPLTFLKESYQYIPYPLSTKETLTNEQLLKQIEESYQNSRMTLKGLKEWLRTPMVKTTSQIDKILLHPFWGSVIFVGVFYLIFHAIYSWSTPLMDLVDGQVLNLSNTVSHLMPEGMLQSLIVDGVIAGVGGVIIFLPQIMILFFLLSFLEQSGYISRAAFLTDKIMAFFGLNGKAFLPYMSGFACAIPAIMSTRTIPDKRERMATLMTIPLITCSARLPVYILLIGTFIPDQTVLGFLNLQALSFFFLYFLGSFFALLMAKFFRLSFFKGKTQSFLIEMPLFQKPSLLVASKQMLRNGKSFLKKAGTLIFAFSLIIWALTFFPRQPQQEGLTENQVAALQLEQSYIGHIGKSIEPVIQPLGYDWKMGVGLLIAFGARELFVSGLGTIYALGDVDEESKPLQQRLKEEVHPVTGQKVFNLAVAWSLLIFFVFACQCTSTLAIVRRETAGWKWPLIMFSYMGLLAYVGAFIAYRVVLPFI